MMKEGIHIENTAGGRSSVIFGRITQFAYGSRT